MKVCAVIPAAGLGSRLGQKIPKILLPITDNETVWSILRKKLFTVVDHIHIIASPHGEAAIRHAVSTDKQKVSVSIQPHPLGMGDAIFQGHAVWSQAEIILIIWGDQIFVSEKTLSDSLIIHDGAARTVALPLTKVSNPYVEYVYQDGTLLTVRQSREGDICSPLGYQDVGTFVLSVEDLLFEWFLFSKISGTGFHTGEINFLPFLPFLARQKWHIRAVNVDDPLEARGINTAEDLAFFQTLYEPYGTS